MKSQYRLDIEKDKDVVMSNKIFEGKRGEKTLTKDFMSSIVVFLVALPLCMGVAIASGAPPALGLITGITGGLIVGVFAGNPLQVSGPAAGLTVLIYDIISRHGLEGMGVIVLVAGIFQMLMGALKIGQWFRAISPAVVQGMLAGIGVLIIASQFHVMIDDGPKGSGLNNIAAIPSAIMKALGVGGGSPQQHGIAALIGIFTIVIMFAWNYVPKKLKLIPAPLVAITVMTLITVAFGFSIKRVQIPGNLTSAMTLPTFETFELLTELSIIGSALALCFIASAETLLSATAVDRLHVGERTNYDRELFSQGIGNTICGMLGALPMTGVIVRSSVNVEAGAKTRKSTIFHGAWLLLFVALLPFVLNQIPTAALGAMLVYTGIKLVSPKVVKELKPFGKLEVAIYFVTLIGVVTTDLLTGVIVGLGAALLKLLYTFTHLSIQTLKDPVTGDTTIILEGSATFLKLPKLATALEKTPSGEKVHLNIDGLSYIDHACLDLISNWQKQHTARDGHSNVDWHLLRKRYRTPAMAQ